jgi:hypothetical protein
MKIKLVTVELNLTPWQKRLVGALAVPFILGALIGLAHAAPKDWKTGD